jgi:[acyl-carrier-protein] S-malonyltransferase
MSNSINPGDPSFAQFADQAILFTPATAENRVSPASSKKTAFLFPGQGAQSVGMGRPMIDLLPAACKLFVEANELLGFDLLDVCLNGPEERLNATDVSQPAIYVASLAALESLKASDPVAIENCVATAGLSLGEYTALVFAGAMSFQDGLRVVQCRGKAMQAAAESSPSGMVSIIGPDVAQVAELVNQAKSAGKIELANFLCPGNTVVSGDLAACAAIEKVAEEKGARTIRLAVAGAFHTELMKPADEKLREILETIEMKTPRIPVWSNVDAKPHSDPAEIRALLVKQVLQPVRWEETMRNLLADGVEQFYEIGPGRVLAGLLKRVNRKIDCRNCSA